MLDHNKYYKNMFGELCYKKQGEHWEYIIDPKTHEITIHDYWFEIRRKPLDMTHELWLYLPKFYNNMQAIRYIKTHVLI